MPHSLKIPLAAGLAAAAASLVLTAAQPPAPAWSEKDLRAVYHSDLGPETIDVSQYPERQQENYRAFQKTCSLCHTPARALFSPRITRTGWGKYVDRMREIEEIEGEEVRMRTDLNEPRLSAREADAIVDFLTYDSQRRKVEAREAFEERTIELQRRFQKTIEERLRRKEKERP